MTYLQTYKSMNSSVISSFTRTVRRNGQPNSAIWKSIAMVLAIVSGQTLQANTNVWSNGGGTKLWVTSTDWSPAGPPTNGDMAAFFNNATAPLVGTVNNTVSVNAQIGALAYGQSNALFHTTKINPGVTLTIASTNSANVLSDGTIGDPGSTYIFNNAITGAGGTLAIAATNGNISVRQPTATAGVSTHMAILDLSGLDTLNANISRLLVAGDSAGNPNNRLQGTLYLAKTNLIQANWQGWTGTNLAAISVSDGTGGNGGDASFLYLGQTNAIFSDSITVAGFLGGHGLGGFGTTTMAFNPIFTNGNQAVAYLRGYSGSRMSSLGIADNSSASAKSTASIGIVDFTGGKVDGQVDSVVVGRSEVAAGGNGAVSTGTLTFGLGTLDVNTIELGYQTGDTTVVYPATGTLNVNGSASLLVNSSFRLAHQTFPAPNFGLTIPTGTLNINGGSVQMRGGSILNGGGNSVVNVNSGILDLQPPGRPVPGNLSALQIQVSDGSGTAILTNAALITASNITVNPGGAIGGNTSFNIGSNGVFTTPGFTLRGTLAGAGSVSGDFTLNSGAGLNPGGSLVPGALAFGGNLTVNTGSLAYDLSDPTQVGGPNDLLTVAGNLTLSGVSSVSLNALSGVLTNGTYEIMSYTGAISGNAGNFQVVGPLSQSRHTFAFDVTVANQVNLNVGGGGSANLIWVGDGAANNWDLKLTSNWNNGGVADKFFSLDSATFTDSGSASPAVNLVGSLQPGTITVSNSVKSYTFSGSGGIGGGASLTKLGTGSLTISGSGTNNFTGSITVSGGQLTLSGAGTANLPGAVGIGSGAGLTVAGTGTVNLSGALDVASGGTLTYNRSDNVTLSSPLSDAGTLVQQGSGVLALSGANSAFDGAIMVNAGTLQTVGTTALGSLVGGTTVASGATLDINGYNLGAESVTVSGGGAGGNGAIINTGFSQVDALQNVTLAADASFGGSSPWGIRSEPTTGVTTTLSTSGAARKLTKVGPSQVSLTSVSVDSALGNIDIRGGILSMENLTTGLGNPASTLTIFTNSALQLLAFQTTSDNPYQYIALNKQMAMNDGGSIINLGGTNQIISGITLSGSNSINVATTIKVGSGKGVLTYTNSLTISGNITGTGSLNKQGGGALYLVGANSFTGRAFLDTGTVALLGTSSLATSTNIALSGGTLDVTGRNDGLLTLPSGQTLSGSGTINGSVVASAGSTISPGVVTFGTITITNGSVTLGGTALMRISKTSGNSSVLAGATNLVYGGTLSLNNVNGTLTGGESFKIFDATNYSGAFTNFVPATPGTGLIWDTSALTTSGTIKVVNVARTQITNFLFSAGSFNLNFSGPPGTNYHVWANTNVTASPISSTWSVVATGTFNGSGGASFTDTSVANYRSRFYTISVP